MTQAIADQAFELALANGRLSKDESAPNYVGDYMYMGRLANCDQFKNRNTRKYLDMWKGDKP